LRKQPNFGGTGGGTGHILGFPFRFFLFLEKEGEIWRGEIQGGRGKKEDFELEGFSGRGGGAGGLFYDGFQKLGTGGGGGER